MSDFKKPDFTKADPVVVDFDLPSRRFFLKATAGAAGFVLPTAARAADEPAVTVAPPTVPRASQPLNILILGGTGFTGPDQVKYALARGHHVTLLNRNTRRPDMFKGDVDMLVGDLGGDLNALKGKNFDVVIDNPTTFPFWVRNAAQYLKGHTKHYIYISTISAYRDTDKPGADETSPTQPMPADLDPYTLVADNALSHYGELKAFSEKEVEKYYPGINTIIRPGLIVGPLDVSDRFTYWPVRIEKGGTVLAPGAPTDPVQYVDARDIAEWTVRMAEMRAFGVYNCMGPQTRLTIGELLYGIKAVTTSGAEFVWVPAEFLKTQKVGEWINMPVWVDPNGQYAGFMQRSNARALAKGLTFRPLAVTAADTLAWHRTRPPEEQKRLEDAIRAGIPATKENEVLTAWAAQPKTVR